jgi:hypothetical protein
MGNVSVDGSRRTRLDYLVIAPRLMAWIISVFNMLSVLLWTGSGRENVLAKLMTLTIESPFYSRSTGNTMQRWYWYHKEHPQDRTSSESSIIPWMSVVLDRMREWNDVHSSPQSGYTSEPLLWIHDTNPRFKEAHLRSDGRTQGHSQLEKGIGDEWQGSLLEDNVYSLIPATEANWGSRVSGLTNWARRLAYWIGTEP